jgi:hypothetical protein
LLHWHFGRQAPEAHTAAAGHVAHVAPAVPHSATVLPVTHESRSVQHPEQFDALHTAVGPHADSNTTKRASLMRLTLHPEV